MGKVEERMLENGIEDDDGGRLRSDRDPRPL